MALTSRRKRPLDREGGKLRDARIFVIATEGEKTEKQYFEYIGGKNTRIHIKVLETEGGLSAPKHVLKRVKEFKRKCELNADDKLWLVIDKDRWPDQQLSQVASEARRCRFSLAVSNPCFELWLYLHLEDVQTEMEGKSCGHFEGKIREILGSFNPSNLDMTTFGPHVDVAISRASCLDVGTTGGWPPRMGTRVYKVVQSIREKL